MTAETDTSYTARRKQGSKAVILKSDDNGNFWLVSEDGSTYWLVQKSDISITEYNTSLIKLLFECPNFQEEFSQLNLIHPAMLKATEDGQTFELQYSGELEFS